MTTNERKILEDELIKAEKTGQAPGDSQSLEMDDYTEEIICSADFEQGCELATGDDKR